MLSGFELYSRWVPLITGIKLLVYDLMFFTKGFKLFIARLFLLKLSCH